MNDTTAAQIAIVSASTERLTRARTYSARLDAHAAEIRAKLDATDGGDGAGPLRGELVEAVKSDRLLAK